MTRDPIERQEIGSERHRNYCYLCLVIKSIFPFQNKNRCNILKRMLPCKISKALGLFYLHVLLSIGWVSMSLKQFHMSLLGKLKNGLMEVRIQNSDLISCK